MNIDDLEKRIKEIEQRCEMKTPGPWKAVESFINQFGTPMVETDAGGQLMNFTHYGKMTTDALFVAHSTSDIPFLLGQLQKYKRAVEIAREWLNYYSGPTLAVEQRIKDAKKGLTEIDKILGEEK